MAKVVTIGVTGASGSIYAQRLLLALERAETVSEIDLIVSGSARKALREELDLAADGPLDVAGLVGTAPRKTRLHGDDAIESRVASGSNPSVGMVIVPCSMGTLARIVHGLSDSLLTRAADVCLKERRRLILVARETPLSQVHLDNLARAATVGATVMPAMPAFYPRPQSLLEMVDHFVARILAHLGIESDLGMRWRPTAER